MTIIEIILGICLGGMLFVLLLLSLVSLYFGITAERYYE